MNMIACITQECNMTILKTDKLFPVLDFNLSSLKLWSV